MVLTQSQSNMAFLLGCIPMRLVLVYLAYMLGLSNLNLLLKTIFATLLISIGISFFVLYTKNLRLNAPEAGGITWWKELRPIHGLFYILAGTLLLTPSITHFAWILLLLDVIFGLGSWIVHKLL
jgi:hypothetical protein